jgi:putative DNA primase/helicase
MARNAGNREYHGDLEREQVVQLAAANGFNDTYAADRFIAQHGNDWRFDHDRKMWLTFRETEQRWRPAAPGEIESLAIGCAKDFLRIAETASFSGDKAKGRAQWWGGYCQQLRGISSVLGVAKLRSPIAVTSADWNNDPWLVGVPNGIIDLRTGKLLQASREHLISLSLGVPYDPKATCPRWEQFLHEIFAGQDEDMLVAYVQRVLGYVLTGSTQEQVWWLLHGGGSNGKSLFLNIVGYILGEYGKTVRFSMFERHKGPSVGDGTEGLVNMRFVSARETMEGARLDEAGIKAFTGSDTLSARPLYGHSFEFEPKLKLFLCANHMPVVTDDSHAFWRRLHVLSFLQCFKKGTKRHDKNLEQKLKAEGPGILAWMVSGCSRWQRAELHPPFAVAKATTTYETESDQLGTFLDSCCKLIPNGRTQAQTLFQRYEQWAEAVKVPQNQVLSQTTFGTRMVKKFVRGENSEGRFYEGLRLKGQRSRAGLRK